jgi:hypothetical protein
MKKLALLILLAATLPASLQTAAAEPSTSVLKPGTGASTEGGASLGGTGIDPGVSNPRGVDETDKRIRLGPKPKPDASAGPSRKRENDLNEELDKQDEEFRKGRLRKK